MDRLVNRSSWICLDFLSQMQAQMDKMETVITTSMETMVTTATTVTMATTDISTPNKETKEITIHKKKVIGGTVACNDLTLT